MGHGLSPTKHDFLIKSIAGIRLTDGHGSKSGWHEHLEIKYVLSGEADVTVEDTVIRACPGDLIFVNPYEIHSISTRPGEEVIYHFLMLGMDAPLSFDGMGFDLRRLFLHQRIRLNNRIVNPAAAELFCQLTREAEATDRPYGEIAVKGLLLAFLSHLFREEIAPTPYGARWDGRIRFYDTIAPAVRLIHEQYGRRITGEELAAACNMSRAHFCRTFKEAMGVPPLTYLTEYRLRLADSVLRQENARVSEAARIAGFTDEAYFSRCYKKRRGTPPSAKKAQSSKE